MPRRRLPEEPDNHDRWLVSYADFITLLFAFFVVMYAVSQVNETKYKVVGDALQTAFNQKTDAPSPDKPKPIPKPLPTQAEKPAPIVQKPTREQIEQRMRTIATDLTKVLQPLVDGGQVRVTESPRGVAVEINASLLFAPGQAQLNTESVKTLIALASVMTRVDNAIQVEGHTDNLPISSFLFPSNWELSAARAGSVVRLFQDNGIDPKRLAALGFGEFRPLAGNDTPTGRARNRRVNVMILSQGEDSFVGQPLPAAEPPAQVKEPPRAVSLQ